MDDEKKGQRAADTVTAAVLSVLFCLMCRLWPVLLLMAFAVPGAALCGLMRRARKRRKKEAPGMAADAPAACGTDAGRTERDAYVQIQEKITSLVCGEYPGARWVWEEPMSMRGPEPGREVHILLDRAGGYRRAEVIFSGTEVMSLRFPDSPIERGASGAEAEPDMEDEMPAGDDQSLLAFQWTEANMQELNSLCTEATGRGESELLIPLDDLPDPASWEEICRELDRNGIKKAKPVTDGILLLLS